MPMICTMVFTYNVGIKLHIVEWMCGYIGCYGNTHVLNYTPGRGKIVPSK